MLEERAFSAGDYIINEGEEGDRLFFIFEGAVEILKRDDRTSGPPARLATLGVGDTFGEMELLDIQPRCASVRAVHDVRALSMTCHDLYEIYKNDIKAYTIIILNLARELSRRLRHSDALFASSLFGRVQTADAE